MEYKNIDRRSRLDLCSLSELAIVDAVYEVEKIGADERLTKAIDLLQKARNLVADYLDEKLTPENVKELFGGINLNRYLKKEVEQGKIDFRLRATPNFKFYIHPQDKDGETFDGNYING